MIHLRAAAERGHANHGWLDSWHSFSFADYHDPAHMHWGPLRVINDDRIAAGEGFGKHSHRDMEIITYVMAGSLSHEDSIGNKATIVPGEVQRMSAGTGVQHSEFNRGSDGQTHLLQIWLLPAQTGVQPTYEQKSYADAEKRGRLRLVVSKDGRDGSVTIHQDACLYAGLFDGAERASLPITSGRLAYVHLARGQAVVNGRSLVAGDALLYSGESLVTVDSGVAADLLVFDLPAH